METGAMDGDTGATYRVHGGWINAGAYGSNGKLTGISDGVPNRWNSGNIYSVRGYGGRATDGKYPLPLSQFGGYRNQSLTDSSIFDFYRTLIDGDNKSEFQRWTAYNIDVSQTGWNDRVGLNLIYDRQRNKLDMRLPFHALGGARDRIWMADSACQCLG